MTDPTSAEHTFDLEAAESAVAIFKQYDQSEEPPPLDKLIGLFGVLGEDLGLACLRIRELDRLYAVAQIDLELDRASNGYALLRNDFEHALENKERLEAENAKLKLILKELADRHEWHPDFDAGCICGPHLSAREALAELPERKT